MVRSGEKTKGWKGSRRSGRTIQCLICLRFSAAFRGMDGFQQRLERIAKFMDILDPESRSLKVLILITRDSYNAWYILPNSMPLCKSLVVDVYHFVSAHSNPALFPSAANTFITSGLSIAVLKLSSCSNSKCLSVGPG